ncbi:MAG: hypothetical protein H6817_05845 [Phycisphaerales bacterium]|nr:hypothetical protein [Phycisphaerales bacterium]
MGILCGLSLALLGVLAAPSLLLSRKPNAKELLNKIVPYQGVFGAVCAVFGAWGLVKAILNIKWLNSFPIWWITYLGASLLEFSLGLLLGVGVLKLVIKSPQSQEKMDLLISRLAPKQGLIGLIAICVGAWCVFANFAFA